MYYLLYPLSFYRPWGHACGTWPDHGAAPRQPQRPAGPDIKVACPGSCGRLLLTPACHGHYCALFCLRPVSKLVDSMHMSGLLATGIPRHRGQRGKKKTQMNVFDLGKVCNTMAATSMAKVTRQHVGGKCFTLDVFRVALKWLPLYYISSPGQKRSFAFFFSLAGCRFVNSGSSRMWLSVVWSSHCSIELQQGCAILAPARSWPKYERPISKHFPMVFLT